MHQTGLLAQFQHVEPGDDTDIEPGGLTAMEQSPEDAGYSPTHAPTVEEGENLDSLSIRIRAARLGTEQRRTSN
jgi:hypothetical protein